MTLIGNRPVGTTSLSHTHKQKTPQHLFKDGFIPQFNDIIIKPSHRPSRDMAGPPPVQGIIPSAITPALPQPLIAPCQPLWNRHLLPNALHDASQRHPVFFTEKLRRGPLFPPMQTAQPQMNHNPITHGYVYQDTQRPAGKVAGPRL